MAKEIIIGREGNQPFLIVNKWVSCCHAKVIISEYGEWFLEDTNSDNGTHILTEKGNWEKVNGSIRIFEDSIIRLGGEHGNGVIFMAHRLNNDINQDDYSYEFDEMRKRNERFERMRKRQKHWELVRISLLIIAVLLAFVPDSWINNRYLNGVIDRLAILIPTLFACWIGWQGKRDRECIDQRQEAFAVCPNPSCNYLLDKGSQKRMECPRCKAKFSHNT